MVRRRCDYRRKTQGDGTSLALKTERGPHVSSRSWERRGIDTPLELPEKEAALLTWILVQGDPGQTTNLQNCKTINLWYFKAVTTCMVIWQQEKISTGERENKKKGKQLLIYFYTLTLPFYA